jgi:hypothetical protein
VPSETPSAPQTGGHAPDGPERHPEPAERSTEPTADANANADDTGASASAEYEARIAELKQRVAELEQEKADREREDAITDLAMRHSNVTPEMLRVFGNVPLEELRERAAALDAAIHEHHAPARIGSGGLDPTRESRTRATWPGAFRRAREERSRGRDGVTLISDSRTSGEL